MEKPKEVLKIFEKYTPLVDGEIKRLLSEQNKFEMYDMMSYFFGYLDEELKEKEYYGGKRFRPGLCLMFADFYDVLSEAVEVATSIEIFHNFTLIHDDIADRDETRRGRPTVWKKWGINHGLNTGDGQLLLVDEELMKYVKKNPEKGIKVKEFLNKKYLEVVEGQYLDFYLSELPIDNKDVTESKNLDMIGRKSGILVGAPVVAAGIIAGVDQNEQEALWNYGFNLGLTYQLCDDYISVWGSKEKTGKDELADIREKKKTLPVMYLFNNCSQEIKNRLKELYGKKEQLNAVEVAEVKELLESSGAKEYLLKRSVEYLKKIDENIENLSITEQQKDILREINKALFPFLMEDERC